MTSSFVSLSEMPLDLLVPPKFKSKRLPRPGRSLPVMSSPPRLPSQKDQLDWKVPPFISPWKNPRGYTIPLDKRQRPSEGGDFTESLRAAEVMARLMEMRALVGRREQELQRLAFSARAERAAKAVVPAAPPVSVTEDPEDEKPKAKHGDSDICGAHADEQLEKVTKKTDEGTPARAAGKRERPVELDEPEESDDPFDLDQFMAKVKKGDEH
jgi:SNW domain-containing protein 1